MSIFGLYFTKNMLSQMDWPRKRGLFSKEAIDTVIFDSTIDTMIDWAAAIGAGNPELALQIIAYIFSGRDWESDNAPQIKIFVDEMNKRYQQQELKLEEKAPHEIVRSARFSDHTRKSIPARAFQSKDVQQVLETDFLNGIVYGLSNSSSFEKWYKSHSSNLHDKLPIMQKAGLDIEELPSLDENYKNSEQIIRDYEKAMELSLPPIPEKLLADAKSLGLKLSS